MLSAALAEGWLPDTGSESTDSDLLPMADRIRSAMSGGLDAAAEHVPDEWVEPFVITGPAAECGAEIRRIAEAHDIDEFLLPMFDMPDQHAYLARVAAALGLG